MNTEILPHTGSETGSKLTGVNWKQLLKRLKLEDIRRRAPGFFECSGGFSMGIKPYSDKTANGLTISIIDWITFLGGEATRQSVQGQVRKINGVMKFTHGTGRIGGADIRGTYKGRSLSIEVKIGRDTVSDAQVRERERIINAGGLYVIARSFPEFLFWWETQGFETLRYTPGVGIEIYSAPIISANGFISDGIGSSEK